MAPKMVNQLKLGSEVKRRQTTNGTKPVKKTLTSFSTKAMDSLDTKLRLLQNKNDLKAFELHERRIAQLLSKSQNLDRARWIAQDPYREH